MVGQKFKVKGSLDNSITKSIEFSRPGSNITLADLKSSFERLFNLGSLGLRYKFADGRVQPLYQDFHIQDAIKDCEKTGQKFITLLLIRELGSSSYTGTSTAPRQPTTTTAPPKVQQQSYTPSSSSSSSSGAPKKIL